LLVKSYQEQREKNRKTLAIITGDNELVVH
jgi:hypothetical protein